MGVIAGRPETNMGQGTSGPAVAAAALPFLSVMPGPGTSGLVGLDIIGKVLRKRAGKLTADDGDTSGDDAASVVRGLVADIRRATEGKFNIVVIKATIDHDASGIKDTLKEEEELPHREYGTYKVYVFGKGTFVNKGDGGFSSVCCSGKYTQSGGRYTFQEI